MSATNLLHLPADTPFLCLDKAVDHDSDGHVNVVGADLLAKVHPGVGLSKTNHAFQVTHGDRNRVSRERSPSELGIDSRQAVDINRSELGLDALLGVHDVLFEQVLRDDLERKREGLINSK